MNSNEIISNGEKFINTDFNGVSIIMDSDGYYNASKVCRDNGKTFKDIRKQAYWRNMINFVSSQIHFRVEELIKEKIDGYSIETRGFYIHPLLISFLCSHVNYQYAFYVGKIMLAIDDKLHDENKTLKDYAEELYYRAVPINTNVNGLFILDMAEHGYPGKVKVSCDQMAFDTLTPNKREVTLRKVHYDVYAIITECPAGMNLRAYFKNKAGRSMSATAMTRSGTVKTYNNLIDKTDFDKKIKELLKEDKTFDSAVNNIIKFSDLKGL